MILFLNKDEINLLNHSMLKKENKLKSFKECFTDGYIDLTIDEISNLTSIIYYLQNSYAEEGQTWAGYKISLILEKVTELTNKNK